MMAALMYFLKSTYCQGKLLAFGTAQNRHRISSMRIAVAGGTGTAGRHVVAVARERGHDVVTLSRSEGVDLVNGRRLSQALEGADVVIDVSGIQTVSTKKAVDFFTNA